MAVRWGILGTANIAKWCTIPGIRDGENCELYAIAGRNPEKVESYKEEFGFTKGYVGYDKLLEDPEVQAVYIPLPNNIHKEWVIKALRAGKNVLCEKPLAMNADEAEEMYEVARQEGRILMEAYAYLHSPYIDSLKNDLQSGLIGDVDYLETEFLTQGYFEDFRLHKELGGGAVYDLGCYCTTMIRSLFDGDIELVFADAEFGETGVDVFASVLLKVDKKIRASFNVGMNFTPGCNSRKDKLYIHGSRGVICSDVEYNQAGELSYTVKADGQEIVRNIHARQNYTLEAEQLSRCIENGEVPHISPDFSIKNARLLDEILEKIGF
jgi:predicted dehydrogenase